MPVTKRIPTRQVRGNCLCHAIGLLMACIAAADDAAAETYRWVDSQGAVHYTDQLPPEEAKRPRAKLNENAKVLEVVVGQLTPEQLAEAKRLKQLRAEQQRILQEQIDSDTALSRTYRTETEMNTALNSKLATLDTVKKIAESNRQHQVEVLRSLVKRAADIENAGQKVPQTLRDSIESTRRQISLHQDNIRALDNNKAEITATFKKDQIRFKNLQDLRQNPDPVSMEWHTQPPDADVAVASAVQCPPTTCEAAWEFAKDYVIANSKRPLTTETPTILQTASPREEKDIALLVVRINNKNQESLFLDTSCHFSSIGEELCASETVKKIRSGFAPYIEARLKSGH